MALAGKTALITGGGRGIGRPAAATKFRRQFAALGAAQGLLAERAGDLHAWPDRARDQQAVFATRIAILGNSGSGKSTLA